MTMIDDDEDNNNKEEIDIKGLGYGGLYGILRVQVHTSKPDDYGFSDKTVLESNLKKAVFTPIHVCTYIRGVCMYSTLYINMLYYTIQAWAFYVCTFITYVVSRLFLIIICVYIYIFIYIHIWPLDFPGAPRKPRTGRRICMYIWYDSLKRKICMDPAFCLCLCLFVHMYHIPFLTLCILLYFLYSYHVRSMYTQLIGGGHHTHLHIRSLT